ncbi:hypothetical protein Hanom_Chr15g01404091 [Helianthus anomalus]
MKLEQDFHEEFRGSYYDSSTAETVISLRSKEMFIWRCIRILDPMWLVNLSNKDVECLFFTKIWYEAADKVQAMQYQNVINTCYAKDIHSGRMWETNWRELERKEFLKEVRKEERVEARVKSSVLRTSEVAEQAYRCRSDSYPGTRTTKEAIQELLWYENAEAIVVKARQI